MSGMRLRVVVSLSICLIAARLPAADDISFQRDIRPILSDKCFICHGPDDAKREADLRLDRREGAFAKHEGKAAFAPGSLTDSDAWQRIISEDPDKQMPPADSGKALTPAQKELIRRWIEQGAQWSEHWAFLPPKLPAVPVIKAVNRIRNPIDNFVLQRLEREGLSLSPEADRATLLRRLSLDLIGLPPTIAEVDAFLADQSPGAYERQVERLLQSPHYGERWARLWLDAARYADSDGFEKDKPRFVWAWRDWVIKSFNNDLPYDRFLFEQLAGDLLPHATQDQIVATGFLRNSMINEEGGVDPEQFRMEAMFDRMDAIGKSMLGLTIQCCQCHNHKYDPLTQADYYRLFAFLNNDAEGSVAVYTAAGLKQRAALFEQMNHIVSTLQEHMPDWKTRTAAWEESVRSNQPQWETLRPELDTSGGQKHYLLDDGSILCAGYAPTKHTTEFSAKVSLAKITGLRLENLNDPNLPCGGPGRSIKGLFALSEIKITVAPADDPAKKQDVKLIRATADINSDERDLNTIFDDKSKNRRVTGPVSMAIDGDDKTAWSTDIGPGRSNVPSKGVFEFEKPIEFPAGAIVTVRLVQMHGGWNSDDNQNNNLGRFRLSVTDQNAPVADPVPVRVRRILAKSAAERSASETREVFDFWRTLVPEWKDANEKIEMLWKQHPEGSSQLVLHPLATPRETHMLKRGDFLKPGDAVRAGVPEVLNPPPKIGEETSTSRLALAAWMSDRQSPTVARVAVNRIWQTYFGTGLVATSEDLGTQSDPPSHPELLDWLSVTFMDGHSAVKSAARPWSLKQLHRLIVTSATYRQSSQVSPELLARDPGNRLLARAPRFRVDAEIVRDIALKASGLLNEDVGGPSVYPPAPDFLFQPPASYGPKVWKEETGPNRYRRALYTFRFRSVPYPMLQTFDAPNGDAACVRRTRANTPLQALTTLNEPIFVECAQALALRTLREGGDSDSDRLRFAFRCCVARHPSADELAELISLLHQQTERFEKPESKPLDIAARDPAHPPALPNGVSASQLAAWTIVSRVLLNLDETITRE